MVDRWYDDEILSSEPAKPNGPMKLRDLMTRNPISVSPETSLEGVVSIMKDHHIGFLPVVGHNGIPKGVITDRDIALRAYAESIELSAPVSEVMSKSAFSVNEDCTLDLALHLMETKQIGRVLVCNEAGRLTGVLTLGDANAKFGMDGRTARVSKALSQRSHRPADQLAKTSLQ